MCVFFPRDCQMLMKLAISPIQIIWNSRLISLTFGHLWFLLLLCYGYSKWEYDHSSKPKERKKMWQIAQKFRPRWWRCQLVHLITVTGYSVSLAGRLCHISFLDNWKKKKNIFNEIIRKQNKKPSVIKANRTFSL